MVMLLGLAACKKDYAQDERVASSLKKARVVTLTATNEPLPIYAMGKITAEKNIRLSFKIGGIIASLPYQEGQYVRKGQVLASLNQEEIASQVTQAKANVDKLSRDLDRYRRLLADSAATLQSVQDIETNLQIAQSGLRIANFNRKYSQILAPASGRVLQRLAEPGELISAGQPIYLLASQEEGMVLKVGIADRDVVRLKLGDQAEVVFDAYADQTALAEVNEIAAEGHPAIGTFEVELRIKEFPAELKNGFFAKAKIFPSSQPAYFKVPMHAMVEGLQDKVAIFTTDGEKASRVIVEPQYIGEDFFTVDEKKMVHDLVITEGAAYLRDGESFETLND